MPHQKILLEGGPQNSKRENQAEWRSALGGTKPEA
ncbi:hypothetical protein NIASO_17400 [Niabella soli DSM 19437]|uniref:Uncharacterized protein n=1 Tax=Niabella soli DSM 19437 TaxID=929713 RepID=W0F4E2_9BACT|nr:hypothetical protein NIASO_17400 [Niabella soli DSM 19437]